MECRLDGQGSFPSRAIDFFVLSCAAVRLTLEPTEMLCPVGLFCGGG
jgi:hypothetical protein